MNNNLPIHDFKEQIVEAIRNNRVMVVVGETGSGKTTQIPLFLYEAGIINGGRLGITQPRKIAAISVAEYVADQLGESIGGFVGYKIRFDNQTMDDTKIKFMTDGILLREMQVDQDLSGYSVIVVDEAHERSQNIDFILGMLKDILKRRENLKVIITSATIDQNKFSKFFWDAPVINVSGRMYPVEVKWSGCNYSEISMIPAIAEKIKDIHLNEKSGDILVFVSGVDEINKIIGYFPEENFPDLVLLPAHGLLDSEGQKRIFDSYPGKRKVVVATNIAESSITIDGIVYIIDSGFIKQNNFHPESGIQSLDLVDHSRSGCEQRAGRAGRTQPGICYRMYTQTSFQERPVFTEPEIKRTSLANVVLMMEDIGINDVESFDFIDQPDPETFREAYETLIALGAIERGKKGLTTLGKAMAKIPLEPKIARMIFVAEKYGCVMEVVTISAFLSARNIFVRPKDKQYEADLAHMTFNHEDSDALTFLNVWERYEKSGFSDSWCYNNFLNSKMLWEISKIRHQILDILYYNEIKISSNRDKEGIMKAVVAGFAHNLLISDGMSRSHSFRGLLREIDDVFIHPGSSLFRNHSPFMVAGKILRTTKSYAHIVTIVKPEWILEIAPHLCRLGAIELLSYYPGQVSVLARRNIILQDTIIGQKDLNLTIEEAYTVQQNNIKKAREQGLVPLIFEEKCGYLFGEFYVKDNPLITLSFFSRVEPGVTYYCHLKDFFDGKKMAEVRFKVFNFKLNASQQEEQKVTAKIVNGQDNDSKPVEKKLTLSVTDELRKAWGCK